MDEFMEFGLFQLENLFLNPNRFIFLDLRESRSEAHPQIDRLLSKATAVHAAGVKSHLKEQKTPPEFPVVLVCEKGCQSQRAARELTADGFVNVYVIAGGVEGLLSEV